MNSKRFRIRTLNKKSGLQKYSKLTDEEFVREYLNRDPVRALNALFGNKPLPKLTAEERAAILKRRPEIERAWLNAPKGKPSREAARRIYDKVFRRTIAELN